MYLLNALLTNKVRVVRVVRSRATLLPFVLHELVSLFEAVVESVRSVHVDVGVYAVGYEVLEECVELRECVVYLHVGVVAVEWL